MDFLKKSVRAAVDGMKGRLVNSSRNTSDELNYRLDEALRLIDYFAEQENADSGIFLLLKLLSYIIFNF
jgi:hypothetical protein